MSKPSGSEIGGVHRTSARHYNVVVAGGEDHAIAVLRLLADFDSATVCALYAPRRSAPAVRLAEDLGVFVTYDLAEVFQVPDLDVIIDASNDLRILAEIEAQRPSRVAVVGAAASWFVWDLLVARKRGEEQERLFIELQVAYDRIRDHERELQTSKGQLVHANEELESRLAEIFFTHEFFKALTSFTSVEDVCSLIVDGCNGILGAEISCVYLFNREDWTLRLRAAQGRDEESFCRIIPVSDTIIGYAFREGVVQEAEVKDSSSRSSAWMADPAEVVSQAAVPLKSGEEVFGVMVVGSSSHREFSQVEMDRLQVLGNQSSLALQNALLHGELERLSVTDRLTDLYNNGYFKQRLEEEFHRASRFDAQLSLILMDIDDFKRFNDSYGHVRGDEVLRRVSALIKAALRDGDIAARYGGEEFVILLPETTTEEAVAIAQSMRMSIQSLEYSFPGCTDEAARTVSVGVATFPEHASAPTRLIEAADAAMYRVKRSGKNQVGVYRG